MNKQINNTIKANQVTPLFLIPLLKNTFADKSQIFSNSSVPSNINLNTLSLNSILKKNSTIDNNKKVSKKELIKNINKIIEYKNEVSAHCNSTMNNNSNIISIIKKGLEQNENLQPISQRIKDKNKITINRKNRKKALLTKFQNLNLQAIKHNNRVFNFSNIKTDLKENNKINNKSNPIFISNSNFIKSISIFQSDLANYNKIVYNFNKNNNNQIFQNIYSILESAFYSMSSLISKPVFYITPSKIKIQLFYFWNPLKKRFYKKSKFFSKFLILNNNRLKFLASNLSLLLNKPVELELTRLYYPHYDSNILANLIGLISNIIKFRFIKIRLFKVAKVKNPKRMTRKIYNSVIPSVLSGLRLKLAGRVLTQKMSKRVKALTFQKGSLARNKATLISSSRFTNKNKRGAFSVTVTTGNLLLD
uniref:ribosomal protein S3 n=1 Tax=Heterobasidion annosum TaxID=13563 RepID=UPI002580CD78|nr:ribosomal protein S3 [Heterobasidion annosum]WHL55362.1 ribosomal protein S3 [Heterobasidion annosum]